MRLFSTNGTNRQEDIFACNIARSNIARSLELEVRKTELLVTAVIARNEPITLPIVDLWKQIQADATLRSFVRNTDAHVEAYTQFAGWVRTARLRLAYTHTQRLITAFGPRIHAHRFRNCDRLTRLHLSAARVPS
jgi:hypothetical protein